MMINSPTISIIVPVFNAEKFLRRCIDSILCQVYQDFELILVDDGSSDSSAKICDDYSKVDQRVKVIHQKNQGVSVARNVGLDVCRGKYVCFIDADDFISINYLQAIDKCNADIVIVEVVTIDSHQNEKYGFNIPSQIITEKEIKQFLLKFVYTQPLRVPWMKFFKKACVANTRFVVGQTLGEDTVFCYNLLKLSKSIEIRHGFYYYAQLGEYGENYDTVKYRMSAEDAAFCLSNIYHAFVNLQLEIDKKFWYFQYFFNMCDKRMGHSCASWYSNPVVKHLEKIILPNYSRKERFGYYMWRLPLVGNLVELYWYFIGKKHSLS